MSVADENTTLRTLLRGAIRELHQNNVTVPTALVAWWQAEQTRIAEERALEDARKAEKRRDIEARIATLNAELAKL